jgi:hypothetical protein
MVYIYSYTPKFIRYYFKLLSYILPFLQVNPTVAGLKEKSKRGHQGLTPPWRGYFLLN